MRVYWLDSDALAQEAARRMITFLIDQPNAAIALPAGKTPLGLYDCLAKLHDRGKFDCNSARFFNLDEFVGLSSTDPRSYAAYLWKHFLGPVEASPSQVRLLHGNASDLEAECRVYDRDLANENGLDLAVLGLGANGHLAFNEPGDDWGLGTHLVTLAESTRQAQLHLFGSDRHVPRLGLTMGIATLRAARAVLLLVVGQDKLAALQALLAGRTDLDWPVTSLLGHPELTILADRRSRNHR
jgi:glucosamine-6-phosphate deaminase